MISRSDIDSAWGADIRPTPDRRLTLEEAHDLIREKFPIDNNTTIGPLALQVKHQSEVRSREREANSRRYGAGVVMLLPLSDGHWAILGPGRQLIGLSPNLPTADALREWSTASQESERSRQHRTINQPPIIQGKDFDL